MGEVIWIVIERAAYRDAPSPEIIRALSLRRKIIAAQYRTSCRIAISWKTEIIRARGKTGMMQPRPI